MRRPKRKQVGSCESLAMKGNGSTDQAFNFTRSVGF